MTELMKQIQQWADEGLYDWENGTFQWDEMGNSDPRDLEPFDAFRFVDGWEPFVQCVLDGTIPVWRPIEHYSLPSCCEVLALFDDSGLEYGIIETGSSHIYNDINSITHWMPLPQSPKKAGEQ